MQVSWLPDGDAPAVVEAAEVVARLAGAIDAQRRDSTFVVGIAGSVAVGKSTLAAHLAAALAERGVATEVVGTDAFLLANERLDALGLTARKGFPETYDEAALCAMVEQLRAGGEARIPVYSHEVYDIVPGALRRVGPCAVVVVEGVNALQARPAAVADRCMFLRAAEADLGRWYCERFLALCRAAEDDPHSFYRWAVGLDEQTRGAVAQQWWEQVNLVNLREHIAPSAVRAHVVIEKASDHSVRRVRVPSRW